MATSIWPDSKITVANDTRLLYPEDSDIKMSFEKFHELYPSNLLVITIYLNSENYIDHKGDMDQKSEIEKYMSLAKMLQKNRYVSSHVSIGYLTSSAYERFDELKKQRIIYHIFTVMKHEQRESLT